MSVYTQSIWQKVRDLFVRGFNKVNAQELQIANAVRSKLSVVGYALTRVVFFAIKLAVLVVIVWFAFWLLLFMAVWFAISFFALNRNIKQHYQTQQQEDVVDINRQPSASKTNKRPRVYDNNGNLID